MFGTGDETLALVFDILLQSRDRDFKKNTYTLTDPFLVSARVTARTFFHGAQVAMTNNHFQTMVSLGHKIRMILDDESDLGFSQRNVPQEYSQSNIFQPIRTYQL